MTERGDEHEEARTDASPRVGSPMEGGEINRALRELSLSFRRSDRALAQRMSLKPTEYQAMEHILDGRGELGPLDLAARLGLAPGTTSELLDRMEHLGHVVRHRDERDRRRVKLSPTSGTIHQIIAAISPAANDLDQLVARFDSDEQQVIHRFLREAIATLDAHANEAD